MPLKIYSHKADSDFWRNHWKYVLKDMSLTDYYLKSSKIFIIEKIFQKYLPQKGKIVEAGCGLGALVYLLRKKGYDIEGVDFAEETVNFIKSKIPTLPVKKDNILFLKYPDNYFKGYISLGVVEHFEEGPLPALKEANRVLNKKGVMILSVPYFNIFRKLKNFLNIYNNKKGERFYQYFYTGREIKDYIEEADFKIIKTFPYNPAKCFKDEILKKKKATEEISYSVSEKKKRISTSIVKRIINTFIIRQIFGHAIIIVAQKKD